MRVYEARIFGFMAGLLFSGVFPLYFEVSALTVALTAIIEIFMRKEQILTGTFGGLLTELVAGYFLREFITPML
jgi:hypothetical protein